MNKGFTLIELLVVVLIIGILAAIALPQYTKAVERSRVSAATQWLGDAATAQSIYYMQHNNFATTLDNVAATGINAGDMTIPTTINGWTPAFGNDPQAITMTATRDGGMYDGSVLQISVAPDGAVRKCYTAGGQDGFESIATTAGYTTACGAAEPDEP